MDRLWQMSGWLAREARFLDTNLELFKHFCMKLLELGVLLDRSWLHIRALHPQYAGMARLWTRETGIEERYLDHGFEETSTYLTSPVRCAVEGRETGRWRLDAGAALPFPLLDELRAAGYVDYAGDRLDFTVIGRDVILTSRIERLCRELDQQLIMSGEFVARLQEPMFEIGHFRLRGVPQMQLLFGLPPAP